MISIQRAVTVIRAVLTLLFVVGMPISRTAFAEDRMAAKKQAINIYVSTGSHDGLLQHVAYSLNKMFSKDSRFIVRSEKNAEIFVVNYKHGMKMALLQGKEVMIYDVNLTKGDVLYGRQTGVCYVNRPTECARDIYRYFSKIIPVNAAYIEE